MGQKKNDFFFQNDQIWQVFPANSLKNWVIGLRDKSKKAACWVRLSDHTQPFAPYFSDWWWGIADVTDPYLYVHAYQDPGLPVTKGCYTYEIATGNLLWEHPAYYFIGQTESGVILKDVKGMYHAVDRLTGAIVTSTSESPDAAMRYWNAKRSPAYCTPTIWIEQSEAFQHWQLALKKQFSLVLAYQIEQIDYQNATYLYVYEKGVGKELQGSLIYWPHQDSPYILLQHQVSGLSTASFFIHESVLAVLKTPQQLQLISLT